jgi:predicted ATP-dependent serine protease
LVSSKKGKSLGRTIYLGEVSLTGIVKNTYFLERRIIEAVKLGFDHLVIPKQYSGVLPKGPVYTKIGNIGELDI